MALTKYAGILSSFWKIIESNGKANSFYRVLTT